MLVGFLTAVRNRETLYDPGTVLVLLSPLLFLAYMLVGLLTAVRNRKTVYDPGTVLILFSPLFFLAYACRSSNGGPKQSKFKLCTTHAVFLFFFLLYSF